MPALDSDAVYHELLADNRELKGEIGARWRGVLAGGKIDRKKLGGIVFNDRTALLELNAIAHKYVREEIWRRIAAWEAQGKAVAAIDAIALIESGTAERCDVVVGVAAPAETRIKRIMARDGIARADAEARVSAQQPAGFYEERCDYMLESTCGSPMGFEEKCKELFAGIMRDAHINLI